jgi:hypothetical protein
MRDRLAVKIFHLFFILIQSIINNVRNDTLTYDMWYSIDIYVISRDLFLINIGDGTSVALTMMQGPNTRCMSNN